MTQQPLLYLMVLSKPSNQELKHQDAQGPEVHAEAVAFVEDDLWSHVLRRPTEGPRPLARLDLLGKAKVHLRRTSSVQDRLVEGIRDWLEETAVQKEDTQETVSDEDMSFKWIQLGGLLTTSDGYQLNH
jgi:hypothetical protein